MNWTRPIFRWGAPLVVAVAAGVTIVGIAVAGESKERGPDTVRPLTAPQPRLPGAVKSQDGQAPRVVRAKGIARADDSAGGNDHRPVAVAPELAKRAAEALRTGNDSPEPDSQPVPYQGVAPVEPGRAP